MKCIAFSGLSIHSIEDQINYFLEENDVKILNISISTTDKLACAVVIYVEVF